jgi:hypothetical protein
MQSTLLESGLMRNTILRIDYTPESHLPATLYCHLQVVTTSTGYPISDLTIYPLPHQVLCPSTIRPIMYIDPAKPPNKITKYGLRRTLLLGVWDQFPPLAIHSPRVQPPAVLVVM